MTKEVLLQANNIVKAFGSNKVLLGTNFSINKGEVMALLGENGAGKSTLVKIITGVYNRDGGEIIMDGVEFPMTFDKGFAEKNGISIIYQELSVIPTLTVAQNIFLNREPKNRLGMIDYKKMNRDAEALIEKYGFDLEASDAPAALKNCKKPVIFFHGTADDFVPWEMSQKNYDACPTQKKLVCIPGAGHGLSYLIDPPGYLNALREFGVYWGIERKGEK